MEKTTQEDQKQSRRRTRNWKCTTNKQSRKNWEQEEQRKKTHPNQKVYIKNKNNTKTKILHVEQMIKNTQEDKEQSRNWKQREIHTFVH